MLAELKIQLTAVIEFDPPLMTPLHTATSFKSKKAFEFSTFWQMQNQFSYFLDSSRNLRQQLDWLGANHCFEAQAVCRTRQLAFSQGSRQFQVQEMLQEENVSPISHNFTSDVEDSSDCYMAPQQLKNII